jgi:hypothetical protein
MIKRRGWLGFFTLILLASIAPITHARQGVIKTNDGQTYAGDINENGPDANSITVTIHGGTLSIPRASVLTIDYSDQFDASFGKKLAALESGDVEGRLALARDALAAGKFDLATQATQSVLEFAPHNTSAQDMLASIQAQKNLVARMQQSNETTPLPPEHTIAPLPAPSSRAEQPSAAPGSANATEPSTATSRGPSGKFLTMDDVYTIRRDELLPTDNLHVDFLSNVRANYIATAGIDSFEFLHKSETDQALEIIQYRSPKLAPDIHILSDPVSLQTYRSHIQSRFITGCAASGCHGQAAAANFFLYPNSEEVTHLYTNFFILQKTSRKLAGGDVFGAGPVVRPMIDRVHPDMSLLLQYTLPRSQASLPHPDVTGYRPLFRNDSDPGYAEVLNWITSLKAIVPDYGINFTVPTGADATQSPNEAPQPTSSAAPALEMAPAPATQPTPETAQPDVTPSPEASPAPNPTAAPSTAPSTAPTTEPNFDLMK